MAGIRNKSELHPQWELHAKSEQLLEKIANCMYDRNPDELVIFTVKEIHVIEEFLQQFSKELLAKTGEY